MPKLEELDHALALLDRGLRQIKGIGDVSGDQTTEILFDEWDWEIGVGLYGRFRDCEARADDEGMQALARWYQRQIEGGLPARQINSTAPMLTLALLAEKLDRPDWCRITADWAQWLNDDLPKTDEGGFEHTVKEGRNPGQLWDDTLVMAVLFLAIAARHHKRDDWLAEAHYQYLCHIRFLGDRQSGLFVHGWTFEGRHNFASAPWARGNAWLTIAIPELFRVARPTDPAMQRYLVEVFKTQLKSLASHQAENGMFHTLVDDPTSPVEASATAGIGYGIMAGKREGLIDDAFDMTAERALNAILSRIGQDGLLADVSDGTPMGHDLDFYKRIPNCATPYGQSLAALLLLEARRAS